MNRSRRTAKLMGALAAFAGPLAAQTTAPNPPIATYWISAETSAHTGFQPPPALAGLLPKTTPGGKRLRLDLGSTRPPGGEPRATHAVPPELMLGEKITLAPPSEASASVGAGVVPSAAPQAKPRGRMLIYWGCSEQVRPGQPVIVEFDKLDAKAAARVFQASDFVRPAPPAPGSHRAYGAWPNEESHKRIADAASLRGLHVVSGNFVPDMQFSIDAKHDFMPQVEFEPMKRSERGALLLNWKGVANATGYFATAMAPGEKGEDVVVWSSSEVQEPGQGLLDYVAPPEVERLIKEKVVLTPQTNSCMVPVGIFKSGNAVLNFIAYGEELNLFYPQRPKDPKEKWSPQWGVKVRLKSTAMTQLAEGTTNKSKDSPPTVR